jgi:hypothetical protein
MGYIDRSGFWQIVDAWAVVGMGAPKRARIDPTGDGQQLRLRAGFPAQATDERLRPTVLWGGVDHMVLRQDVSMFGGLVRQPW